MMESKRLALEKLYKDNFQPEEYLTTYYRSLDSEVEFFLRNLHHFFFVSNGGEESSATASDFEGLEKQVEREVDEDEKVAKKHEKRAKEKRRVLEIGSGPVPISMISASRWCEWIVCSDFLEQNRQKIKQWLMTANAQPPPPGQKHDETWLPFFRYVAQLERAESETILLDRVRHSVRAVVPCNVLLTDPLMDNKDTACNADGHSLYDVIITTLCLEFATLTLEEYSTAVANVTRLLRPGGFLIVQGALENSHYWHNNQEFPSVVLNRAIVESSLTDAGCQAVDWKELARCCPQQEKPADHSAVFYCLARKI
ncbi:nicotinamide N-methyltransferase-like [Daphnia carinata]|uniref:nicotinamide N-methyltransferase-like n=1 Tax=Daphnia carinata TaxID=120202 RepID=UPI002580FA49|nr:nicotinamide N-methyltransferase-like [Daphnia carinata]